jgi:hypothetical protein
VGLKVGDLVVWDSQSDGKSRTKQGVIVEVIPPGKRPNLRGAGSARKYESYLVRVGGRIYWPRVIHLKKGG